MKHLGPNSTPRMKRSGTDSGTDSTPRLLGLGEALKLLAACKTVDEAKSIRDKAQAIRSYLRQQGAGRAAQNDAGEIKIRAERRLGELLTEQKVTGERASGHGDQKSELHRATPIPTLADLGIKRNAAKRWQDVASLPETQLADYVRKERAKDQGEITTSGALSLVREIKGERRRGERISKIVDISKGNSDLPIADGPWPVIYADPPWRYEHVKTESRAIENQYPTMALEDICALDVGRIVTPDALLFLWATSPKLAEAMQVIEAWGFTYRTSMVWVKDKIGMGYYARQRHELLLICTKGSPPVPVPEARPDSVFEAPRGAHSAKPLRFYEFIEAMYPSFPRVELFCRSPRTGWDAWGNQSRAA